MIEDAKNRDVKDEYMKEMVHSDIVDPSDPTVISAKAYNATLSEMKEELLEALNNRKD
jgi:hypothetical protein